MIKILRFIAIVLVSACIVVACGNDKEKAFGVNPLHDSIVVALDASQWDRAERLIANGRKVSADNLQRLDCDLLLGMVYYYSGRPDELIHLLDSLAPMVKDFGKGDEGEKYIYQQYVHARMAYFAQYSVETDSALYYGNEAKRVAVMRGDNKSAILAMSNLADVYRQRGELTKAVTEYDTGIRLNDSLKADSALYLPMFSGMACTYNVMRNTRETERWLERMETLAPHMTLIDSISLLSQRGNCRYFAKDYAGSLSVFRRLDSLLQSHPDMVFDRMVCDVNLADNYIQLHSDELVGSKLDDALRFLEENHITAYQPYVHTLQLQHLINMNALREADVMMKATVDEMPTMNPDHLLARLKVVSHLLMLQGHNGEAMSYIQRYSSLNDSLRNMELVVWSNEVDSRYMRDQQLAQHKEELQQQHIHEIELWLVIVVLLLVIVCSLSVGMWYFNRIRRQRRMAVERLLAVRSELVRNRITPHFISNALALGKNLSQEDIEDVIRVIRNSLDYPQQLTINLGKELEMVDKYVKVARKLTGYNVLFTKNIDASIDLVSTDVPAMGLLIFIENAIKHGKPDAEDNLIISLEIKRSDSEIVICVRNKGTLAHYAKYNDNAWHGMKMLSQTIELINNRNNNNMSYTVNDIQEGVVEAKIVVLN